MKKLLIILILWVTILLFVLLAPIGFVFTMVFFPAFYYTYSYNICVGIDKLGNVMMCRLFNLVLIRSTGHQFGNINETISSVLGKNKDDKTLLLLGKILVALLNRLQKNHCELAIETTIIINN